MSTRKYLLLRRDPVSCSRDDPNYRCLGKIVRRRNSPYLSDRSSRQKGRSDRHSASALFRMFYVFFSCFCLGFVLDFVYCLNSHLSTYLLYLNLITSVHTFFYLRTDFKMQMNIVFFYSEEKKYLLVVFLILTDSNTKKDKKEINVKITVFQSCQCYPNVPIVQ